ncbi:hypothetical protein K8R61_03260, partial [bacterium]|nr:hypothetical protein [bacterium]
MRLENNSESNERNHLEKNLEAIKIIGNEIVDIINGQGCLIKPKTTILFGPDDKGDKVKIKNFETPYSVTSHGYMYCAEVIGKLSNGDKFYIHAQSPFELEKTLTSITNEIQKELPSEKLVITEVRVKSDFDRYDDEKNIVEEKKQDFERRLKSLGATSNNIAIENE